MKELGRRIMANEIKRSSDRFKPVREEFDKAKAKLDRFDRLEKSVRSSIESEKGKAALDQSALDAAISDKITQYNKYQEDVNIFKDRIEKLKHDISDWKQWYNFIADIDKSEQIKRLDIEIRWRGEEIRELQHKIGTLEARKLEARIFLMQKGQKQQSHEKGLDALSADKDPRLLSAISRKSRAAAELDAARKLVEPNS